MPPKEIKYDYWFEIVVLVVFIITFGGVLLSFFELLNFLFLLGYLAPIFIILDIILLLGVIYAGLHAIPLRQRFSLFEKLPKKVGLQKDPKILSHWQKILERAQSGTIESLRYAIIEADALVDSMLKRAGYEGDHMADRLSQILPEEVKSLEALWRAHRLRNDIVHTPGFIVNVDQAKWALKAFEDFMKELNAL